MQRLILIILTVSILALSGLWFWYSFERQSIEEKFIQNQIETVVKPKQNQIEKVFVNLYQNIRTITLLPSIRNIQGGNRQSESEDVVAKARFTEEGRETVQQIYNNLVGNVSVSEVYAVINGLDAKNGEVPFFMFDTLVFGQQTSEEDEIPNSDVPEELETAEYNYFPLQIEKIKSSFPHFDFKRMDEIPAYISPMMRTCDNAQYLSKANGNENETFGILYSVPFYQLQTGELKGVISAIIRANAFEAVLMNVPFVPVTSKDIDEQNKSKWQLPPPSRFVLSNQEYNIQVSDRRNPNLSSQITEGTLNRNVFRIKLNVSSDAPWELSYYLPESLIEEAMAETNKSFIILATVVMSVLTIAIFAVVVVTRIRTRLGGDPESVATVVNAVSLGNLDVNIPIDVTQDSVLGSMVSMLQQLKSNAEQALENQRIRQALDNVQSSVMVTDAHLNIIYLNNSASELFAKGQQEIRKLIPHFDASLLMGGRIDMFFTNSSHEREKLINLTDTYRAEINIANLYLTVVINPVINQNNEQIGFVTEWVNRINEIILDQEVSQVVIAATEGNFINRINEDDKSGIFLKLSQNINQLLATTSTSLNDVGRVLTALAHGKLTEKITDNYSGTFKDLKDDSNATVDSLKVLVGEIKAATESINTAAKEIAAGNNDLSHRTEEQAASLEQTAASIQELTMTVLHNTKSARNANELALNATEIAGKGVTAVAQVVVTMDSIHVSSSKVVDIISVIDSIAFQTNILALNAAVEAARAGEQGRGFAVVAGEVRILAQRAAAAAREIKHLIGDSFEKIENGTCLVTQAGKTMEEIVLSIRRVANIMSEIAAASEQQSTGIEQVNLAINQMDTVTQQNAALVEQAAAASESLEEQAYHLSQSVSKFKVDD
jgi:methyl-accepting chemotaxis protein